jgi:predicted enzyme related to lactoylglutathione lyase
MIKRIATVGVYVEDQSKSLEFWTKQAGFEVRRNTPMGPAASWIEVAPPGAESCFVIYPRALMENWRELKASLVLECDDIEATVARMKENGVTFTSEPQTMSWGTYAKFIDLDGNEFMLKG